LAVAADSCHARISTSSKAIVNDAVNAYLIRRDVRRSVQHDDKDADEKPSFRRESDAFVLL
jgi:hypothetical protein